MDEVKLTVQYFGLARNLAGRESEEISLPQEMSVRDMVARLVEMYGDDFRAALMTSDWRLRRYARILLDKHDIRDTKGLDTTISRSGEASIIVLIDPIIGG